MTTTALTGFNSQSRHWPIPTFAASLAFGTTYRLAALGIMLAPIALWARERQAASPTLRPVPVYFIGVGERLEDLETFDAREFALALLS